MESGGWCGGGVDDEFTLLAALSTDNLLLFFAKGSGACEPPSPEMPDCPDPDARVTSSPPGVEGPDSSGVLVTATKRAPNWTHTQTTHGNRGPTRKGSTHNPDLVNV